MKHRRIFDQSTARSSAWSLVLLLAALGPAHGQTPEPRLRLSTTLAQVPAVPAEPDPSAHWSQDAQRWQPGSSACSDRQAPRWDRLTLDDALAHTLCQSPGLRQALADVAEQRAGVDIGEVALRPRWSANAEYSGARNFNSFGSSGRALSASLGLSWVLFDFGQRSASLQSARQTLAAALAAQDNALLDGVRELVRLYGEGVVATAALEASQEAEAAADQTAAAALARYQAQVGNQIDRLQAQTALAQATLERVRAQSVWDNARAQLALALGAEIGQPLRLADWEAWVLQRLPAPELQALRQEARAQHPRLRTTQAQIDALRSRLQAVQADNKGSVSLSASGGNSRNWGAAGSGNIPTANAAVVASIPLFNGREADAQARQVLAQIASREAEREAVLRDIDSQLWQAHQAWRTSQQSLLASDRLLESAAATHRVAQGRYKAGVGSMQDLLSAQSTLADARRQRVGALVEQLTAQTQLSLATGRVGPAPAQTATVRTR
ncbi:MAG: TolC family protein [Hydrogenophaga sp.]|uniref:TolC family protein n=1 Tax=Hydrogenophaga sp. TaxID=1904254 RepID=UPI003D9BA391